MCILVLKLVTSFITEHLPDTMCIRVGVLFLIEKWLYERLFRYYLTKAGSVTVFKASTQGLFAISAMNLLTKGRYHVHFLIIRLSVEIFGMMPFLHNGRETLLFILNIQIYSR